MITFNTDLFRGIWDTDTWLPDGNVDGSFFGGTSRTARGAESLYDLERHPHRYLEAY